MSFVRSVITLQRRFSKSANTISGQIKIWNAVSATAVLLVAACVIVLHFWLLIPGPDAGIYLYGGMLISKGYLPYRHLWDNKPPLIYCIGAAGYLWKAHPFILIRVFEIIALALNFLLIRKTIGANNLYCLLAFAALYLLFWDGGFLTETFTIPLTLLGLYLFVKRNNERLPLLLSATWWLLFLLKPNSVITVTLLMLADLYQFRGSVIKRLLAYCLWFMVFAAFLYMILSFLGIFRDFVEQVFVYNLLYSNKFSFRIMLQKQVALLQFKLIFAAVAAYVFFAVKDRLQNRAPASGILAWVFIAGFIASFVSAYATGKNFYHYFLLCIVPATYIIGDMAARYNLAKVIVFVLIIIGLKNAALQVNEYRQSAALKMSLIEFVKANTLPSQRIFYAGKSHAYLYALSGRMSYTKFITPFAETWDKDSEFGKQVAADVSQSLPDLLIIPQNNLSASASYYEDLMAQLPRYTLIARAGDDNIYKLGR